MDDRVFEVLFKRVCSVVEALQPFTLETADIHRMWFGPRGFFLLSPKGVEGRVDLVRHALRYADWAQKFSAEYLNTRLRDIIEIHATQGADQAKHALRSLVAELEAYAEEHTVYLPIFGIAIPDAPTREFGGIVLHQATTAFLQRIAAEQSFDAPYVKRQTDAEVRAEVRVTAEPTHAVVRAEERCTALIDTLRFWMACMTPKGTPCAIGLQGDVVTTERPRIIFNNESGAKRFDPHRSRRIPGFPLTQDVLKALQHERLDAIAALIDTPAKQQTAFDKLLLHALHVFGNGKVQAAAPDRFLNLVTCLETFLSTGEGNITQNVAEGVVMFFAVHVSERIRLKKELQRLYKIRSKLSHGEHAATVPEDLYLLEDLVKSFLLAMIEHRDQFRSKQDLLTMLEQERLS
jgi:hypothetical protein